MARNVKNPGKYGGHFYFTDDGGVRYGKRPEYTVRVAKLFFPPVNPYEIGNPHYAFFEAAKLVSENLSLRDPRQLKAFLIDHFWKKRGLSATAMEAEWQAHMQRIFQDATVDIEVAGKAKAPPNTVSVEPLHIVPDEAVNVSVSPAASVSAAPRQRTQYVPSRTTEPIWQTLDLSGLSVQEAPDYLPRGLKLKLPDGTKLALSADAEEMAWDFATKRLPAKDDSLKHCWDRLVKNFSEDFSAVIGRQVNLDACDWKQFTYAAAQEKAEKEDLKEKGKLPKKKGVKGTGEHGRVEYKDAPEQFVVIDGAPERVGAVVLPQAGMFRGTSGHTENVGRWRRKVKLADVLANGTALPKGWKGQSVTDKGGEWILSWDNTVTGEREYKRLHKQSLFKQKRSEVTKQQGIDEFTENYEKISSAIVAALNSSDPHEQEVGFAAMLMDTMHARIGNKDETREAAVHGVEPTVGVVQFTTKHLKRDGSYKFLGKDHVQWDSNFSVHLPLSDPGVMTSMNKAGMTGPKYDARPIYDRLAAGKGSDDFLFSIEPGDVNDFLRRATGTEHVHNHNFRHFHGTRYFISELKRFEKKLDAMKKAGTLTATHFKKVMDHCGEVAAVKLGHRRTVSAKKAAEVQVKRAADLAAAKKAAKAKGKKFDEASFLAKYKTVGLGASTTRGSYIDFDRVLGATYPRWGFDFRSNTEKRNTLAMDYEKKYGIPLPSDQKKAKTKGKKKTKKSLVVDLSKAEMEIESLSNWSPLDDDPVPRPVDGDNTYASHWYYASEEWRSKMEKSLRLVMDLTKAIGTKQSAELKPAKQAKKPAKSSGQYVDPKNGKKRYQYKGKTPDKGKAPTKKQAAQPQQPQVDPGPPPVDAAQLATALQVPLGTLQRFAQRFKGSEDFQRHMQTKLAPFLRKHNIGNDRIRRLYEALTKNPQQQYVMNVK